jgi:hypothetical protein
MIATNRPTTTSGECCLIHIGGRLFSYGKVLRAHAASAQVCTDLIHQFCHGLLVCLFNIDICQFLFFLAASELDAQGLCVQKS